MLMSLVGLIIQSSFLEFTTDGAIFVLIFNSVLLSAFMWIVAERTRSTPSKRWSARPGPADLLDYKDPRSKEAFDETLDEVEEDLDTSKKESSKRQRRKNIQSPKYPLIWSSVAIAGSATLWLWKDILGTGGLAPFALTLIVICCVWAHYFFKLVKRLFLKS